MTLHPFERGEPDTAEENKTASSLPLLVHAEVPEIGAPFADRWYCNSGRILEMLDRSWYFTLGDRRRNGASGRKVGEEVREGEIQLGHAAGKNGEDDARGDEPRRRREGETAPARIPGCSQNRPVSCSSVTAVGTAVLVCVCASFSTRSCTYTRELLEIR